MQGGASPFMTFGAGIITGVFWFILGITGTIRAVTRVVSRPIAREVMLGLGLSFVVEKIKRMRTKTTIVTLKSKREQKLF